MHLLVAAAALAYLVGESIVRTMVRGMLAHGEVWAVETSGGYVGIVPSTNAVLAFSLPVPNAVIWPLGLAVCMVLVAFVVRARTSRERAAFGLIMFGAIPNLVDRIIHGGVTDYFALTNLFPAFNGADLLIFMGVGMLVFARGSTSTVERGTPAR